MSTGNCGMRERKRERLHTAKRNEMLSAAKNSSTAAHAVYPSAIFVV